jgi:hypothetical protein
MVLFKIVLPRNLFLFGPLMTLTTDDKRQIAGAYSSLSESPPKTR